MYTPGNNASLIEKARLFEADVIVLDLEDSVPPAEKLRGREMTKEAIPKVAESGADIYVRINDWATGLTHGDLEAVVQPSLAGIVLPKTESREDVVLLDRKLKELERRLGLPVGHTAIQCIIETAKGVINAYEAGLASPRVNSLVFGAVDYTRDMRVEMTKEGAEILHARSQTAIAARASGTVAIDPPWPAFTDVEGFIKDVNFGRQLGYEGRMLIHPNQIEPSNKYYLPPDELVEYAKEACAVFEEGMKKGSASVPLRGKMIDWAVYRANRDILAKMELVAERERIKAQRRKV
jgi:citrate lyase subunit beta/citryl-CoA lyase